MSYVLPPVVNNSNKRRDGGGGTPNKCRNDEHAPSAQTQQQQQQQQLGQQVPVEFEISIRLRPLGKKERDDYIVLEVVPPDNTPPEALTTTNETATSATQQQLLHSTSVALHPLPRPELTPSSALILQTLSPETIQTCHDVEFRFDHVFGTDSSQDTHVYPTLGRPMAHSVMEPLMKYMNGMEKDTGCLSSVAALGKKTTHLVIAMGSQGSGKTYTCWGGGGSGQQGIISKRKSSMDGLVPRMMDSLFQQYIRISSQQNRNKTTSTSSRLLPTFAVNLSVLQVNQSKNPKHNGSSNDGCKVYDLFQPVVSSTSVITSVLSPKVKSLVASFERSRNSHSHGSPPSSSHHRAGLINSSSSNTSTSNLDALVHVHQDPITHEFHVMTNNNGHQKQKHVRTCKSAERARESLQEALQNSRKRTNSKRYQSHVLIQIQPVMFDSKTGNMICKGGTIVVLDMAGANDAGAGGGGFNSSNKTRLRSGSKRNKDSLPNRNDAHSAVLHCLRSLQFNEQVRAGCISSSPKSTNANNDSSMSGLSSCPSSLLLSNHQHASFKQVPYRQHVLTMLLQPCFSSSRTDQTQVSILLAASPGHRDYHEKKAIMTEFESFWTVKTPPAKQVVTGCSLPPKPLITKPSPSRNSNKKPRMLQRDPLVHSASDADDEFESSVTTELKSSSSSTTTMSSTTAERRPPKNDVFKKSSNNNLSVKLSSVARKKLPPQNTHFQHPSSDADDEFESSASTELQSSSSTTSTNEQFTPPNNNNNIFKTKCQYTAPAGLMNTLSMAYSDSSMEGDDNEYYTLPPPIAPPPHTSCDRSNSRPSPQRVLSPDASAPPEEHVIVKPLMLPAKPVENNCRGGGFQMPFLSDFPGVTLPFSRNFEGTTTTTTTNSGGIDLPSSLSTVSHHSNSSESLHQRVACDPLKKNTDVTTTTADHDATLFKDSFVSSSMSSGGALADESGSSSSSLSYNNNNNKFSAIKNINKLVHASKKKCERVFEKMSTAPIYDPSHFLNSNDNETVVVLKKRINELEVQNADLLRENQSLRHENEQLRANKSSSPFLSRKDQQPWPSSPEKQQHSVSPDKESITSPRDQRLHLVENDGQMALSPGKTLVANPGRSNHNNHSLPPLSPGKPVSSPESEWSQKENAFSPRDADRSYSHENQPRDGPLALMPGQPLSIPQHQPSLKQNDRLHILATRKPTFSSDKQDEYDSKLTSCSPLSRSRTYPSDDENVSPPPRRAGISIPMPGEANYIVTEDMLKHPKAPTSPMTFSRRDDAYATLVDPLMQHIANLSSGHGSSMATGGTTTSSPWQCENRPGAGSSSNTPTPTTNDNAALGSFSSNYKSTLYRWQA